MDKGPQPFWFRTRPESGHQETDWLRRLKANGAGITHIKREGPVLYVLIMHHDKKLLQTKLREAGSKNFTINQRPPRG